MKMPSEAGSRGLSSYSLGFDRTDEIRSPFGDRKPSTARWLEELYQKYGKELEDLSETVNTAYGRMRSRGFRGIFGDVEAELLYCLVRETRPSLVYEISPHAGYSTNYLLSALSANGSGEAVGFEILPEIRGEPTEKVISSNLGDGIPSDRYELVTGDARRTVTERLGEETPDLVLIDSCHEDYFAEFYIKILLPRVDGPTVVHDICHFDPRPEPSTEALYLLNFFQMTGTDYLPVGVYEDHLDSIRASLGVEPRRPARSNAVLVVNDGTGPSADTEAFLQLLDAEDPETPEESIPEAAYGSFPLHLERAGGDSRRSTCLEEERPEDLYHVVREDPMLTEYDTEWDSNVLPLVTLETLVKSGEERSLPPHLTKTLEASFPHHDPWSQLRILQALSRLRDQGEPTHLLDEIDPSGILGVVIPKKMAHTAWTAGEERLAKRWIKTLRQEAEDARIAIVHRALLDATDLLREMEEPDEARTLFHEALEAVGRRDYLATQTVSREIVRYVLRRPRYLGTALASSHLHPSHLVEVPLEALRRRLGL